MKLKYVVYALTALVLIQIYSIYNLRQINKALIEANESTQDLAKIGHLSSKDYLISLKSEGYALPKGIFLETKDHKKISFDSLLATGPKFVVRYPISACSACVEQQIPSIDKLAKKIGKDNIVLISPYDSPRKIEIIQKNLQPVFDIYLITGWDSQINEIGEAEMFLISSDRMAKHIFTIKTGGMKNLFL